MKKLIALIALIAIVVLGLNSFAQEIVKIGNQVWMNEDLKVNAFRNGDPIPEAKNNIEWCSYSKAKKPCYRKLSNGAFIYNGYAVLDKRGLVPDGFNVALGSDWGELINYLKAKDENDLTRMLATYNYSYENDDMEVVEVLGENLVGFNARLGGYAYGREGECNADKGDCTFWWTLSNPSELNIETESNEPHLVGFSLGYCSQDLGGIMPYTLDYGFSVRCIKINP